MTIHTDMFFHGNYVLSVRQDPAGPIVYAHERGREPYTCDTRVLFYELRPNTLRQLADELEAAIAEWVASNDTRKAVYGHLVDEGPNTFGAF